MSRNRKHGWWETSNGYIQGRIWENGERRIVLQHRYFVEQAISRRLSPNEDVHHRDGNRSNNELSNLEIILHGRHSSITGATRILQNIKGVLLHNKYRHWYGQIKRNGVRHKTLFFKTEDEARIAYNSLKLRLSEGK